CDLRCIIADRLDDLSASGDNGFDRGIDVVDHHVYQQSRTSLWRSARYPGAADLHPVIESDAAIATRTNIPAKDLLVELSRPRYVSGRHFDIADLSVRNCVRHRTIPFRKMRSCE